MSTKEKLKLWSLDVSNKIFQFKIEQQVGSYNLYIMIHKNQCTFEVYRFGNYWSN